MAAWGGSFSYLPALLETVERACAARLSWGFGSRPLGGPSSLVRPLLASFPHHGFSKPPFYPSHFLLLL